MLPAPPADLASVEVAAPTVVFLVVIARLYFGGVIFAPRFLPVWAVLRRIFVPLLQQGIYRYAPINVSIEGQATKNEYVGVVDLRPSELAMRLDGERDIEIPLLASYKHDWQDVPESGTMVWYCGGAPVGLPKWLSPYQVHITTFQYDGRQRVTAHFEANPWRPDRWKDHLFQGPSRSDSKGVQKTRRALKDASIPLREGQVEV
jgi:hypothetical protein